MNSSITVVEEAVTVEILEAPPGPNEVNTTTDTSITGLLKGADGKVAQAIAGTDYEAAGAAAAVVDAISNPGVAYVRTGGDNGTAAIGNPAKPYATAQAAWDAQGAVKNIRLGKGTWSLSEPDGVATAAYIYGEGRGESTLTLLWRGGEETIPEDLHLFSDGSCLIDLEIEGGDSSSEGNPGTAPGNLLASGVSFGTLTTTGGTGGESDPDTPGPDGPDVGGHAELKFCDVVTDNSSWTTYDFDGTYIEGVLVGSGFATATQGTDERVPTATGLTSKFGTAKATIADNDRFASFDSAAANVPKHNLWSLIKSTLKTYFDSLYLAPDGDGSALTGIVTTPADGSISNAKLANMAEATIKGRAAAAGTGVPVDLSASQVRTALGLATTDTPVFASVSVGASGVIGFDPGTGWRARLIGEGEVIRAQSTNTNDFRDLRARRFFMSAVGAAIVGESSGVAAIDSGASGQYRDLKLRDLFATQSVKVTPTTFASLPAAATAGDGTIANITDGATTTLGGIATGSGSLKQTVRSNGADWRVESGELPSVESYSIRWDSNTSAAVTLTGSTIVNGFGVRLTTGTTNTARASRGVFGVPGSIYLAKSGEPSGRVNWANSIEWSFAFAARAVSAANVIRAKAGNSFATGDLSARGLQVRIVSTSLFFGVHNGTTLTESSAVAITADSADPQYSIRMLSEAGTVKCYVGGVLEATLTGGPSTLVAESFSYDVEAIAANSTSTIVSFSPFTFKCL